MVTGNLNLDFVKEAIPQRLAHIVDPVLLVVRDEVETGKANAPECLVSILGIGVTCSSELPRERMNVERVSSSACCYQKQLFQAQISGARQATPRAVQMQPGQVI